jgi:NAD(P)-dependent dehydrogenase (short-subunit alcohol dehydrogenase family)
MEQRLQRTALVTGGRRGIGAAIVAELTARNINVLAPTRDDLELADTRSIEQYIEQTKAENRQIDILVNNAGINIVSPVEEISHPSWLMMLQVNLGAPLQLAQAFAPLMRSRQWGRIVNISSIFGLVTRTHRGAYSATKSALQGLTRTLAVEFGDSNVLANCVAPGYVETELTRKNNSESDLNRIVDNIPLGRMAQPAEIAKFVSFLCSDDNTYITGQVLAIDGGFTCQ